MKTTKMMMILAVLLASSCTSNEPSQCMPTDPCWKRVEKAYALMQECEKAYREALDRRPIHPMFLDIYLKKGNRLIKCP